MKAYGVDRMEFGPEYLIPKPFDHRVLIWESVAVAQAAMESGVALEQTIELDEPTASSWNVNWASPARSCASS